MDRTIGKNFIYNFLLSASQLLLPLITFPYASRVLLPEGMGSISFVENLTQYFMLFSALGIPIYGVREIAKVRQDKEKMSKLFSELLTIHFLVSMLMALCYWLLAINIAKLHMDLTLCKIGIGFVISNVFTIEWLFTGNENFKLIVFRSLAIRVFCIALLFLFVKSPDDKSIYYGINLFSLVFTAIINMYFARRYVNFRWKNLLLVPHIKQLLILLSITIITSLYVLMDTVLLGFFSTRIQVAFYAASLKISKLFLIIIGSLVGVLLPRLSSLLHDDKREEATLLLNKALRFSLLISVPLALGIICLSKELVMLISGKDFAEAALSLKILASVVIIISLAQIYYQILIPLNKEKYIMFASLAGVAVCVIFNLILIPIYQHIGSAISTVLTESIVTLLLFIFSQRLIKLTFPWKLLLQNMLVGFLFFGIRNLTYLYTEDTLTVLIVTVSGSVVVYMLLQWFFIKDHDIRELVQIASRKYGKVNV
ncbi:hypothetical protein BWI97_01240 [Siphonobacter sp. BAB-5405]|uniref:flippase n=1 Tax=Siphonobacter sp. BAB-5405 TaxID=1864825 RepID=UPI000C8013B7|nr:flippase [Siphonobacter sp. BAB-5405]PMD99067.1 hypothetical protein BWI97_01240 [Siphonobacter sp. BAB-5405]